jgi:phospholipid-binding lipoprotein MlaA
MPKAFQLRLARLGLGFALLAGLPACAELALVGRDANVIAAGGSPPSDTAIDDPGYDELFDDELFDDEFEVGGSAASNDPFEITNRALLTFNRGLGRYVFDPVIRGYQYAVPEPARRGVHKIFVNFNAPATLVNDLLQLCFKDAGQTLGRFVLNTTLGFGGIFDVGIEAGWEHHEADFGQTLGRMGFGSGPYLVLPIFGPNTIRDGIGDIVDLFFQPLTYLIGPTHNLVIGATSGISLMDAKSRALKALEESSDSPCVVG